MDGQTYGGERATPCEATALRSTAGDVNGGIWAMDSSRPLVARILVVDDEPSIRTVLAAFLEKTGFTVDSAEDAKVAQEMLAGSTYDVVVSDIVLPGLSGVQLLHAIRKRAPDVQVIMMTGEPTVDTATEALRAGAFDYLTKPVSKADIVKVVTNAARLRMSEQERMRLYEENQQYQNSLEVLVAERSAELHKSQDQLRQAQKMEAIGRLGGGVAHDFNNLLTIIGGAAEFLREEQQLTGSGERDLEEIQDAVKRASALTRQLLAFSRKQTFAKEQLDLGELVAGTSKMLRRLLGEDVELSLRAQQAPYTATVDPGQIEQVIMNLVVNARDAMPNGGRMSIELTHTTLDDEQIKMFPYATDLAAGPYALISVSDSGTGMDAETQRQIFEPFFTTKDEGKGTGLGLSTVYGIVRQHRGYIAVESAPGEGTTFRVYIRESMPNAASSGVRKSVARTPGGKETILCVEDNLAVRRTTVRILENLGYRLLTAENAEEAIAIVKEHPDSIHLLLTDVIMPGMNGAQLANAIALTHPGIRVLYASGYPADHLQRRGLGEEVALLHKPFTRDDLARSVRSVLDGDRGAGPLS